MKHLSHKIRLSPTPEQEAYFRRACGVARFTWNWAVNEWDKQYAAGGRPNGNSLRAQFNAMYAREFPWISSVHRDCHSQPFANLQRAFVRFFKRTANRPTFKKKGLAKDAFYVANDQLAVDGKAIRLPRIGVIRMREALRLDGRILSATVSREADRWFISISVEGDFAKPRTGEGVVGVDLGIKTAVVTSDGQEFQAPKPLAKLLKKLKRLSRSLARKVKGSVNRTKAKLQLARLHARISDVRRDFWHKVTTKLCSENQAVGVEDLNVKGMAGNKRLSRSLSDVSMGMFRPLLSYKAQRYGTQVQVFPRFYPSSKTCSKCGEIKDSLSLSERVFRCDCGNVIDRDLNASLNLRPTTPGHGESYACGPEGSGPRRKTKVKPRRVEAGIRART